ncbi:MAG: DNA polymerase III subunit alpha [Fusobacteriia bacterium 4572_132]|nr:MAG: DNA polymerase III subunit alpha [Fusobacteriia bacterium 4572_132]
MKNDFTHLHLHTDYSLLDGVGKIDQYLKRAKELKMSSIAITDHGNMFGALEFYKKAIKKGIKPIIGIEAYIAEKSATEKKGENFHLILLAKNEEGYKNLMKLSSKAYIDGFYYKPRMDRAELKKHSEGIIALSACMKGEIPYYILKGKPEIAQKRALEYIDIFGKENFYIELQANGIPSQDKLNDELYELAKKNGLEVVATNDVHYVYSGDDLLQDVLICIQTGSQINDTKRMKINTDELYLKSREEMLYKLDKYDGAIENTVKIARRCNLELDLGEFKFPEYNVPENEESIETYLETLVKKGIQKRYNGEINDIIQKRVDFELNIINKMGYAAYFVVVWDFINYAKSKNIPIGPGRGSAAGSIIAYLLGITELDPIKYNLLFERFLNPARVSMPDIDIDICQERRQELIDYVIKKYGQERVAQIITFGTMKARGAIRDVGRVFGVPLSKIDKVAKLIPLGGNITQALKEIPKFQETYKKDEELRKVIEYARRLEGKVRHASVHAAGIIISKNPLEEETPLYLDSKSSTVVTQYQMKELEGIGLLKMDFLGLRNLTIIQRALEYIEKNKGGKIELSEIKLNNKETFETLKNGDTVGVFQLESAGIRKLIMKLSPDIFEDIIAILALYRPGPLGSGMVDDFIDSKHGKKEIKYPHKMLEDTLKETYGVILYQEQVMKIASVMADFTLAEADMLRRAMGKKIPEIMEENRVKFIERAIKKGVKEEKAEEIFNLIDKFSGYGFNKSHSAAYALVSYWTAYLKTNYKVEFFAALMTSERNNLEKLALYIEEAKRHDIEVLAPDVNYSFNNFRVEDNKIRFGLSAIKFVGVGIVEKIIEEREKNGEYMSFEEFVYRTKKAGMNKKTLEGLILSGGLDSLEGTRQSKHISIEDVLSKVSKKIEREDDLQMSLFGGGYTVERFIMPDIEEFDDVEILKGEKEYVGLYFSGHPLDEYQRILHSVKFDTIAKIKKDNPYRTRTIGVIRELTKKVTKAGEVMAIFMLEDYNSQIKIIVFPNRYMEYSHYLIENNVVIVEGNVRVDSFGQVEEQKILINSIKNVNELEEIRQLKVYILIETKTKYKSSDLKEILKKHHGEDRTYIALKENDKKTLIELDKEFWVNPSQSLIKEVEELLGKDTIVIK